jgi:hypothetical protein
MPALPVGTNTLGIYGQPAGRSSAVVRILHACLLLLAQTGDSWQQAVACKAAGALNLDAACSGAAHLEHFVLFSSICAWSGNEGAALLLLACTPVPP